MVVARARVGAGAKTALAEEASAIYLTSLAEAGASVYVSALPLGPPRAPVAVH